MVEAQCKHADMMGAHILLGGVLALQLELVFAVCDRPSQRHRVRVDVRNAAVGVVKCDFDPR